MMLLYRSISLEELCQLFQDKKINPIFNFENTDSTYKKELGAVTCWFTEAYSLPSWCGYDFVVVADIPESEIVGFGKGRYTRKKVYDDHHEVAIVDEVYTNGYALSQVQEIHMNNSDWDFILGGHAKNVSDWTEKEYFNALDFLRENIDVLYDENFVRCYYGFDSEEDAYFFAARELVANHFEQLKRIQPGWFVSPV
ncbi:hypothetical protein [Parageobacillus thermoglucosidasius]|uniref:Uncharacterized protein n=1 Tax=Parageobacillus thermoglucosidasius TaxID=1426 RepID=A0AB38R6B9_PARTM|nr:hypothetical protein [Parageobacillus thermoglucosidasius]UOE78400.1 hypothetical protein IMI45_20090 [Parageobacillus thermoglucosidasius]